MRSTILATTLAAFVGSSAPSTAQGHDTASQPSKSARTLLDDAALLPSETIAWLRLAPLESHSEAIASVPLLRLLGTIQVPSQIETVFAQVTNLVRDRLGIEAATLRRIAANGFTVGFVPGEGGALHAIALLDAHGTGTALAFDRLGKLAEQAGGTSRSERIGAAAVHVVQAPGRAPLYLCEASGRFVVASSAGALSAITETQTEGARCLAEQPRFRSWQQSAAQEGVLLLTAWIDLREVLTRTLGTGKATLSASALLPLLKLDVLGGLGFSLQVKNGELHDTLRLDLPAPRQALLGALLGEGTRIRPGLASLVPASAASWSITNVDFAQAWLEAVQLASEIDPQLAKSLDASVRNLQQRLGLDLERDLIGNLGTEILTFGLPHSGARGSEAEFAVLLPIHNAMRMGEAVTRLAQTFEIRTSATMVENKRALRLVIPGMPPDFSPLILVTDSHLVLGTSTNALEVAIRQLAEAPENRRVQEFLANLPSGTTAIAWGDAAQGLRGLWGRIAELVPGNPEMPREFAALRGSSRSLLLLDKAGIAWRASSPVGDVTLAGALLASVDRLLPYLEETPLGAFLEGGSRGALGHASLPPIARLVTRLGQAQEAWKERAARGAAGAAAGYGTLSELLEAGLVKPESLGKRIDDHTWEVHDHRVTVLLPSSPAERVSHFAVVAWPANKHTGLVWCSTSQRRCASNDLLARSLGITSIDPRDVWVEGRFAGPMSTGWRDVVVGTEPETKPQAANPDEKLLSFLEVLEKTGKKGKSSPELLLALENTSVTIRARAAFLAGELAMQDAVPKLCNLVASEPDSEAGAQAMAAIAKLVDPRGRQAAITALGCQTAATRAAAASLLGKLRAQDAAAPLVNFLATANTEGGEDKVQALTALADIGSTASLLPAATACRSDDKQIGVALAYLFQTLSKKLEPAEEGNQLMAVLDHPSPLLRRFAIQRLGEMKHKNATAALEGRLAKEDPTLQPLIRVSLDAIRGPVVEAQEAPTTAQTFVHKLTQLWERQTPAQRTVLGGIVGAGVLLILLIGTLVARVRRQRTAEHWASQVAPSEDLLVRRGPIQPFDDSVVEPSVIAEDVAAASDARAPKRPERRLTPRKQ